MRSFLETTTGTAASARLTLKSGVNGSDLRPLKFSTDLPIHRRVPEGSAERLLHRWRPYDSRRLTRRELRIEALAAAAFVAVAVALPLRWSRAARLRPAHRRWP